MWTIECDGPILQIGFGPEDKTVSRKHITIIVSAVKPGSGSSIHIRSELRIQDEGAKFGTFIDGNQVASGASTLLNKDEHTFRLGKTAYVFRSIRWQPVVLSVSFGAKETKAGKDPLASLQGRLEHADIKVVASYIIGHTTHVVQGKRNTSKGLQALINAKYIVNESFTDALVFAITPTDFDHDETLSPLEEDFVKHWPNPMQHVPPKGKEPNERPMEAFAPNPERANVFEGYTFVLCEKTQFESLQGPITNGGGKAMYFALKSKQTTTEELVGYVKNVAGEKGLGELEDGSEGKGVVGVKFRGGKDDFGWAAELVRTASLALDLRFIEQNEFMDAILMNDASVLRRPLEPLELANADDEPESGNRAAYQNDATSAVHQVQPQPKPEVSKPQPPPRRPQGLIKSRFKGFSDDSDDDAAKPSLSSIPQEGSQVQTQPPNKDPLPTQPSNPRKRPAPAPEEDQDDLVDQLLPAATAMKRRRLQQTEAARLHGESPPTTSFHRDNATPQPAKKTPPELDIKKSLRERREAADKAAARDQESLQEDISTADVEAMRNLALIEEFDIAPHGHQNGAAVNGNGTNNSRWDPSWNGRKNFKKFRRQGDPNARRGVSQGVIVPLEEVQKKAFGIGPDYWLESSSGKGKRKRGDKTQSQSQVRNEGLMDTGGTESSARDGVRGDVNGKKNGRVQEVPRELKMEHDDEDDDDMEDVIDVETPRRTRRMDNSSNIQTQTQTQRTARSQQVVAENKGTARGRKAQTQRGAEVRGDGDESDSGDELKFRFGKRRRVE
ncbi:MAG: hypothetical protein Q9166_007723 [cf. Caloplaca sp. 2 TL-2023]